uniref:Apple domain-containing protein n=1 Tax=Physcomitrium patens TaxID=3218 RepID=A0A7I4AH83_PHYPA
MSRGIEDEREKKVGFGTFVRKRYVEMVHSSTDWAGRLRWSYKRATFILCTGNLLVALVMLHAALAPVFFVSTSTSQLPRGNGVSAHGVGVTLSKEELERIEDSNRLRQELLPTPLIERVREIQLEIEEEVNRTAALNIARQKVALELAERLRELKNSNSQATQAALEEWKRNKLKKKNISVIASAGDADKVAAELGVQLPGDGATADLDLVNGESLNFIEHEDDSIPGRPMPPECYAEAHTDYGGVAVRWGLTHHVNSAADCCQACLDQAKNATAGQKKCNIWVYCPKEDGCYSPDVYTHENHECWLKQADDPALNFKGHYDEEYRRRHPKAPLVVPWISGVTSQ